jgi:hypothetical protein
MPAAVLSSIRRAARRTSARIAAPRSRRNIGSVGKLWGDFTERWGNQMINGHQNLFVEIVDTGAGHCRQPPETAKDIRSVNHLMPPSASLRTEQTAPENRERARNIPDNRGEAVGRRSPMVRAPERDLLTPPSTGFSEVASRANINGLAGGGWQNRGVSSHSGPV